MEEGNRKVILPNKKNWKENAEEDTSDSGMEQNQILEDENATEPKRNIPQPNINYCKEFVRLNASE